MLRVVYHYVLGDFIVLWVELFSAHANPLFINVLDILSGGRLRVILQEFAGVFCLKLWCLSYVLKCRGRILYSF